MLLYIYMYTLCHYVRLFCIDVRTHIYIYICRLAIYIYTYTLILHRCDCNCALKQLKHLN